MFSLQMSQVNIHVHPYIPTNRQTKIKKNRYSYAPEIKFKFYSHHQISKTDIFKTCQLFRYVH